MVFPSLHREGRSQLAERINYREEQVLLSLNKKPTNAVGLNWCKNLHYSINATILTSKIRLDFPGIPRLGFSP